MEKQNIFELYKPFRNDIKKICIEESLYVIWAYSRHLDFKLSVPDDIAVPMEIIKSPNEQKGVYAWELELLTREIILHSSNLSKCDKSLKHWECMSNVLKKLKTLEDNIAKVCLNKNNILVELFRIAHRQFPWQTLQIERHLIRYYKLFSYPPNSI